MSKRTKAKQHGLPTYRVDQKSGHPYRFSGVRFFGPPCTSDGHKSYWTVFVSVYLRRVIFSIRHSFAAEYQLRSQPFQPFVQSHRNCSIVSRLYANYASVQSSHAAHDTVISLTSVLFKRIKASTTEVDRRQLLNFLARRCICQLTTQHLEGKSVYNSTSVQSTASIFLYMADRKTTFMYILLHNKNICTR